MDSLVSIIPAAIDTRMATYKYEQCNLKANVESVALDIREATLKGLYSVSPKARMNEFIIDTLIAKGYVVKVVNGSLRISW